MIKAIHLNSSADTKKLGILLGSCIEKRAFIGLVGKLGAGKTTLTQGLAEQLAVDEAVNSPTFLMLNEYHSGRLPLYHFDLYRLQEDLDCSSGAALALKLELDEIMDTNYAAVVVVEWINLWENFGSEYDQLRIDLDYESESDGRQASLSVRGPGAELLLKNIEAAWQPN